MSEETAINLRNSQTLQCAQSGAKDMITSLQNFIAQMSDNARFQDEEIASLLQTYEEQLRQLQGLEAKNESLTSAWTEQQAAIEKRTPSDANDAGNSCNLSAIETKLTNMRRERDTEIEEHARAVRTLNDENARLSQELIALERAEEERRCELGEMQRCATSARESAQAVKEIVERKDSELAELGMQLRVKLEREAAVRQENEQLEVALAAKKSAQQEKKIAADAELAKLRKLHAARDAKIEDLKRRLSEGAVLAADRQKAIALQQRAIVDLEKANAAVIEIAHNAASTNQLVDVLTQGVLEKKDAISRAHEEQRCLREYDAEQQVKLDALQLEVDSGASLPNALLGRHEQLTDLHRQCDALKVEIERVNAEQAAAVSARHARLESLRDAKEKALSTQLEVKNTHNAKLDDLNTKVIAVRKEYEDAKVRYRLVHTECAMLKRRLREQIADARKPEVPLSTERAKRKTAPSTVDEEANSTQDTTASSFQAYGDKVCRFDKSRL